MAKELISDPLGHDQCDVEVKCHSLTESEAICSDLELYVARSPGASMCHDPRWLGALARGLKQVGLQICARHDGEIVGLLPLALVKSILFGRYLVSLPYLNGGGVLANSERIACLLIDKAVELAGQYDVRFLELRHEKPWRHRELTGTRADKLHMRLELPTTVDQLWTGLRAKVRNQVRKGEGQNFEVQWGRENLLPDFYRVFSRNMRDLGTPVFGCSLFREILAAFAAEAELCVVRLDRRPVATALLIHNKGKTDVPSASSLRRYNGTNANMFMYWRLLCRALERGQNRFDFGRSSPGSGTYRFKEQWGAQPTPAVWQYHIREGNADQMRPDNAKFARLIRIWQRLPVPLTRWIGPAIVRGIP